MGLLLILVYLIQKTRPKEESSSRETWSLGENPVETREKIVSRCCCSHSFAESKFTPFSKNNLEDVYILLCFMHVDPWCHWARWYKLIQRFYENGDERGIRLVKSILRLLMLRRTKDTRDIRGRPILLLPPADIQVIECEQSDAERDFYNALFKRSKSPRSVIEPIVFEDISVKEFLHRFADLTLVS